MQKMFIILYFIMIFSLIGCPKKPVKVTKPPEVTLPEVIPPVSEPTIREEFYSIPELRDIYFEFDKYDLTKEAIEILNKNADYLKLNTDLEILVEGHCCECGTHEYNLALGQKRADRVKDYYVKLGISRARVGTISYGEEKPIYPNIGPPDSPLCRENRRAETKIRKISAL